MSESLAVGTSESLYRILVDSVRDYAIFALDATGHVLSWNAGARRIKQYDASEILGRHFSTFYPKERVLAGFPKYELEMAREHGRFEDEGWRIRKDGTRFWANVVITSLYDDQGILIGYAKVTRDLTERKHAEEQRLLALQRVASAEAANRAKTRFLAAMSHELRTPLNSIGGHAELMAMGVHGELAEAQLDAVNRIVNSQKHLLSIVNDLLNYSSIEAGKVSYSLSRTELRPVVDSVVSMMEPQALRRGITLVSTVAGESTVMADKARVEQVLVNLLGNAIKFTHGNGHVTLSCTKRGEWTSVMVHDTGPGIPEDMLESIFEPFVQVGIGLTSRPEGTGLGLAISREHAHAMGGSLIATNAPEGGAVFTLALPSA
jgi:PAS domain S-box-containing protein